MGNGKTGITITNGVIIIWRDRWRILTTGIMYSIYHFTLSFLNAAMITRIDNISL